MFQEEERKQVDRKLHDSTRKGPVRAGGGTVFEPSHRRSWPEETTIHWVTSWVSGNGY